MNHTTLPIVSVVVPMYNVERYINTCLDSVLAQTFKQFELICVDDGCSDGTLDIVQQYQDKRIRVIRQKNRGLSGARNTGIQAAKGLYVALLDADDFWAPEKLSRHVKHLNARPSVGVSYCPSLMVDEQGEPMGIGQFPKLHGVDAKTIFCRNPVGNGSAAVIRRQLLLRMNLNQLDDERLMVFDESLRQSEDIELWTRIAVSTFWKFEGIPEPLTFYRINAGGLSANLQNQFASWSLAVEKNRQHNPGFFSQHYPLAKAYQLRYLARRAIQSSNRWAALCLVHQAIFSAPRMLIEEPGRSGLTYLCAVLSLLPKALYKRLEAMAMKLQSGMRNSGHSAT